MLDEYKKAVAKFAKGGFEIPEPAGSLGDLFEEQVEQYPDHTAIKFKDQSISYSELNRKSNQLARTILDRIGEGNTPVALLMEHGAEIIVAIFAVLKAGKFFVALTPTQPKNRLSFTLQELGTHLILTDDKNHAEAHELGQREIKILQVGDSFVGFPTDNLNLAIQPDHLAAIYYTSGSTGKPKGVIRQHRNILNTTWINSTLTQINNTDRRSFLYNASFGASRSDIFFPLLSGASVYPFDIRKSGVIQLAHWLEENHITILSTPVLLLRQLCEFLPDGENYPNLRLIQTGGSALYRRDVERFQKRFYPNCILQHGFSSTETAMVARYYIDRDTKIQGNVVPAGFQIGDKQVIILDKNGDELDYGQVGEIAVQSRFLSPGYWRRPELNIEKFPPHLQDGDKRIYLTGDLGRLRSDNLLDHIGRTDFMVKIRGYRVEMAEVEGALLNLAGVKNAVVVARKDQFGINNLIAFMVPSQNPPPSISTLRSALVDTLPHFMIPNAFIMLDEFPTTTTGKIDRNAFPAPGKDRPRLDTPYVPPYTTLEKEVEGIWKEVLNLDKIGRDDIFIDLGGHSLLAFQIIARVYETFGVDIPVHVLFEAATITSMASKISKFQSRKMDTDELAQIIIELEGMSDEDARKMAADLEI